MGKLGEAIDAETVRKGPPCDVAVLFEQMDDEDRVDLELRLKEKGIACTIIQAKLEEFGYRIGVTTLRRHRNRLLNRSDACACQV